MSRFEHDRCVRNTVAFQAYEKQCSGRYCIHASCRRCFLNGLGDHHMPGLRICLSTVTQKFSRGKRRRADMGELAHDAGKLGPEDARRKPGIPHSCEVEK